MSVSDTESLVSCIVQMAEAETNPVLEIIDLEKPLKVNKKYPAGLLQFNQTGWRAYYHCHPAAAAGNHRFSGEHGHFHIFVRTDTESGQEPETESEKEQWSHLVALAIDHMGQPLGWFTVNHWVTGEVWKGADVLAKHLKKIPFEHQKTLVECWILSLLSVSRDSVIELLNKRDKIIKEKQVSKNAKSVNTKENADPEAIEKHPDIKKDKGIYLLSEVAISLQELIKHKVS